GFCHLTAARRFFYALFPPFGKTPITPNRPTYPPFLWIKLYVVVSPSAAGTTYRGAGSRTVGIAAERAGIPAAPFAKIPAAEDFPESDLPPAEFFP
ncbi:hypothetical protein, partial [Leclercia adecarboxylata]|uniref:hypothetical protein n=1 Tax=Leclercia adecarboxylata TaxID=83655 RepID=UPI002949166C